uniref:aminomethyl-transferring glycine dehydrogenase n=1 Tax=Neisseria gonorrhoeae TaxID=485 RepID=UPI0027D991CC
MKLSELFNPNEFAARHLSFGDEAALLAAVGEKSMDDFVGNTLPQSIRMPSELDLPEALTEADALAKLKGIASKNVINKSYIGLGYYPTRVPNVILRNVLENPGWYTAYTPYQAEIAQGRLEALLNFQQGCIDLTGFPVAGASLLDEATAAAEAMAMAHRVGKVKSERFFVDARVYPQTLDVMKTRAKYFGFELVVSDFAQADEGEYFGALFQYVGKDGDVQDLQDVIGRLKAKGTIVAVAADIMSLVLLKSPAELGADIALGNTQRFGVPMGFGGPHAAYFAFKDEFKRSAPGRIIGVSKDASGKPALRMALSTREQHIRREKATSNICTAQALLANLAGMYAVYHGPKGVKRIANRIHTLASVFADALVSDGLKVVHEVFFDTVTVDFGSKEKADQVFAAALESGYNLRSVNNTQVAAAFHETSVYEDLADLYRAFTGKDTFTFADDVKGRLNAELLRQDDILQHPVYNSYHTEHEMLRYLKKLEDRDLAMNRSMISLGSCTMKLNATAEMLPITWTEFSDIHPYAPEAQTAGYRELLADMENSLKAITGFDAISFQPNSGAQGEYSGMLAIRRYQEAQGEAHRNICLIPKSAHGTNPATAAMLGLKVVVVDTDEHGNVNIDDLKAKAEQHRDALSAIMITYPSTHGVYEEGIRDICRIIHENGGQVYMDGANLNAQIGIMQPAEVGADVLHMNLHKTFCIPHGGGNSNDCAFGFQTADNVLQVLHVAIFTDVLEQRAE